MDALHTTPYGLFRKSLLVKIVFVFLLLLPSICGAVTAELSWDPVGHSELAGYEVHWGTASRVYTNHADVGNTNSWDIPISSMNKRYYFAITAYSIYGDVSDYSEEVSAYIEDPYAPEVQTQIMSLYQNDQINPGVNVKLWAKVKNTGAATIPSETKVWFQVDGPGMDKAEWAGSSYIKGLAAGNTDWVSYLWSIPANLPQGTYTFRAQVWYQGIAVSSLSTVMQFQVITLSTAPVATTVLAPSGNCADGSPVIAWQTVPNVTWYKVWINNTKGSDFSDWYRVSEVDIDGSVCAVDPLLNLAKGSYSVRILTYNGVEYGPWSAPLNFEVNKDACPGKPIIVDAQNSTSGAPAILDWIATPGSDWYYVLIYNSSGSAAFNDWVRASAVEHDVLCSLSTKLAKGSYKMWVKTYNANGYGPYSDAYSFTVK